MKRFDWKLQEQGKYLSVTFNNWINKLIRKLNRGFLGSRICVNPYKSYDGSDSCRLSIDTVNGRKPWEIKEMLRLYVYLDKSRTEINVSICRKGDDRAEFYYEFNNAGLKQIVKDTLIYFNTDPVVI